MIQYSHVHSTINELKLVIVGSVGAGKSTAIRTVSEVPIVATEARASERRALQRKATTTVAMDYGRVSIEQTRLHLYGSPGQRRFDFMIPLLCKGAAGTIVMIDNGCDRPLDELDYFLKFYGAFLTTAPAVIAVTHYDDTHTRTGLIDYHRYCINQGFTLPVMRLDAREKNDVEKVLRRLLTEINNSGSRMTLDEKRASLNKPLAA
ncbi:MAG: GTP-binding protein [Gammaproteobacteria bacterium]